MYLCWWLINPSGLASTKSIAVFHIAEFAMHTIDFFNRLICVFLLVQRFLGSAISFDLVAPSFVVEPPFLVEFYNTKGAEIPCSSHGRPSPHLSWVRRAGSAVGDIPGLRHVRPNGSLVFLPFGAEEYRQDIHASVYRCVASNIVGTIGSRDVHVRAVLAQQYDVRVYDEFVIRENTAVLKCQIPSFVKDFVTVTAWFRDDGLVIHSDGTQGGKYSVFPSGKLHIREAKQQDGFRSYRCQTKHRLTGETKQSTPGQLIVTESHSTVPPRITYREEEVKVKLSETAFLPCAAEGYPIPSHRWYKQEAGRTSPVVSGQRVFLMGGTLVFKRTQVTDSGKYICLVNNSVGNERIETDLVVIVPIQVRVSPALQTVSVGQPAQFNCTVSGFPLYGVTWMKNLRPLVTNERVRLMGTDVLSIISVSRDDRGVYQCFAHNNVDSAQASGALLLGDEPPVLEEIFPEKTVHPGVSVSLKCTATGSPLPQVTWQLDFLPLPEQLRFRVGDYVTRDSRVVSYVNITGIQVEDGGLFSCTAANEVGSMTHSSRINVFGLPTIRTMPNVTALAGEVMTLQCPAGGYPLVSITWERDGRLLPQTHRQKVFPNGTLTVAEVNKKADEGKYSCIAQNKEGDKAQRDVFVQVMVGPKIEPFSFPSDLEEGMRSIVVCAVLFGDPPITIHWLKDGRDLPPELQTRIDMINDFTSTLTSNFVKPHHNGNYTCVAHNPAATVNHTALMVVNVPPYWKSEPGDRAAVMGESVTIDCQASGFPVPQVRWKKSQGESPGDYRTIISNPHIQTLENGSLVITEVELADDGFYMCQATNGISPSLSAVVRLTVHVPAHFRIKFQSATIRKGETVHLKCAAYGEKPITLVWTKDRQVFNLRSETRYSEIQTVQEDGTVSEVTIISADRRDSALFSCSASNEYGRDETNFQVVVQERPDSPRNVEVKEVTSRTITLAWVQPYSGNLALTRYIVQLKRQDEQWLEQTKSLTVSYTDTSTVIGDLTPVITYNLRVLAENTLGQSKPSEPVTATTNEEAPAAPPGDIRLEAISSTSIKVSWSAPPKEMRRGSIKGYYLGYKVQRSTDKYTYNSLDSSGESRGEYVLTNLRRFTQYVIRLQAFNKAGSGPFSDEVSIQTLEYDPPGTPILHIGTIAATSAHLEWSTSDITPVTGYLLHYREEKGDWAEHRLPAELNSYVLQPLRCGTRYQLQLTSYNKAGNGEPSDVIQLKTEGTAPVAPDKYSFLNINSSFVTLHLDAWHSGGCPISFFIVKYKPQRDTEWFLVSNNVLPETGKLVLPDLTPGTWYNLMMSAQNDAGSTDAEYVFATLTSFGGTVPPLTSQGNQDRRFFKHLSIIVPVLCAVVIVLVVTVVICVLHTRRHPPNTARGPYDQGDGQSRQSHKGDTLSMSVLGKKRRGETAYEVPKDSLYFPSPYATTRVPGYVVEEGSECDSLRSSTRTPSDPQGSHTYDVPFPVRRPEPEDQYSRIKRVPVPSIPTANVYQVPQCSDTEKLVSRWLGQRRRPMSAASEPCFQQQITSPPLERWSGCGFPGRYRTTASAYDDEDGMDCSEDESELEPLGIPTQEEDEEGPEISETECDREIKIVTNSKVSGNNGLRVAMPPECKQPTLTALAVH